MKPERVREVCPVCGSSDLYYEAGGYTGKIYHCKYCDYIGALVVEADEEMAKAIREDYEQEKNAKPI
jgi:transposase-like protein